MKAWKRLVDAIIKTIGMPGVIPKSTVTAIVVQTTKGNCRFELGAAGRAAKGGAA